MLPNFWYGCSMCSLVIVKLERCININQFKNRKISLKIGFLMSNTETTTNDFVQRRLNLISLTSIYVFYGFYARKTINGPPKTASSNTLET